MKRQLFEDDYQPIAKRTRLQLRQLGSMRAQLADVPQRPLHQIFSKLDPKTRASVANINENLNAELIDFVLHEFKSFLHYQRSLEGAIEPNVVNNTLKILEDAINLYVAAGHVEVLMRNAHHLLDVKHEQITSRKMLEFYERLETDLMGRMPHQLHLFNLVTLLNLLRKFREFHVLESEVNLVHWRLHLEIWGVAIAECRRSRSNSIRTERYDFRELTILIADALIYDMSNISISSTLWVRGTEHFLSVAKLPLSRYKRRTEFRFNILAPLALRNQLENFMAGKIEISSVLNCGQLDALNIELNLTSYRNGIKSSKHWHISTLPFLSERYLNFHDQFRAEI